MINENQIVEDVGPIDELIKNTLGRIADSKQLAIQSRKLMELVRECAQMSSVDPRRAEIANKLSALRLRLDRSVN
jgi:hypothetical protein